MAFCYNSPLSVVLAAGCNKSVIMLGEPTAKINSKLCAAVHNKIVVRHAEPTSERFSQHECYLHVRQCTESLLQTPIYTWMHGVTLLSSACSSTVQL